VLQSTGGRSSPIPRLMDSMAVPLFLGMQTIGAP
jgi:hypothetical protein